jgi:hypothetical protein
MQREQILEFWNVAEFATVLFGASSCENFWFRVQEAARLQYKAQSVNAL